MRYKLYTTSKKAWDAMYEAILRAEKTVYLEMYIFLNDTKETHNFLGALIKKAQEGLEVVVIADAYGSYHLNKKEVKSLREAGVEFIFFSHFLKRTHRKVLIIDNRVAFLGGVNINEKIRNWNDLQIMISGKIVKPLLKSFAYTYKVVGGKKESIISYSRLPLKQKIQAFVTESLSIAGPGLSSSLSLNKQYIKKIAEAKESIKIVTPYLAPPRRLVVALESASLRGVMVSIIIPRDTDIKSLNKVNLISASRLSMVGINIYLSKTMNHAKAMLIDDSEALIGSQNLDILSFNFNLETGVFLKYKAIVSELKVIIDTWIKEADLFVVKKGRISFLDRVFIFILKPFYRMF